MARRQPRRVSNMFDEFGALALSALCVRSPWSKQLTANIHCACAPCTTTTNMATTSSEYISDTLLEDKLIDLWQDYPCLYDVRSPEYKNKHKRDKAKQDIALSLSQEVSWVEARMRSLRNRHAKAIKLKSGSERKKSSKKNRWLIEKLQFLTSCTSTNRTSISNLSSASPTPTTCDNESFCSDSVRDEDCLDEEDLDGEDNNNDGDALDADESENGAKTTDANPTPSTKRPTATVKSSRKRQAEEEYNIIKTLAERVAQKAKTKDKNKENLKSATDYFGRYVSETLAELEPRMRHIAQHKINEILFQAQSGTLDNITNQPNFNRPYQQHGYSQPPPQQFHYSSQHIGEQNNAYSVMPNTADPYLDVDHPRLLHL